MAIGYTRETWVDGVQLVDAARLNNIETGVQAACDELDEFYDSSTKEMNTPGDVNIKTLSSNINIGTSSIWIGLDAYISFLWMRSQNSAEYTVGTVDSALANTLSLINYGGDIIIQNADNSDSVHGDIKLLTDGQALYNGVEIATKAEVGESGADLNTLTSEGMYQIQNPNNAPTGVTGWVTLSVIPTSNDDTYCRQMLYIPSSDDMYTRNNAGGTWGSWNKVALKSDYAKSSGTITTQDASVSVTGYTLDKQLNICHMSIKFTYAAGSTGTKTLFLLPSEYAPTNDTEITFYDNSQDLPCAGRISGRYVSLYSTSRNTLASTTWYCTASWMVD